jgi:hypothetical protein
MPTALFASQPQAEVIAVELQTLSGQHRPVPLLVDSGFTGESELILSIDECELTWTPISAVQTAGALQGQQLRVVVMRRVPALSFDSPLIAILADLSQLTLPPGVSGIAGLSFLRRFDGWGAERTSDGSSQFFLFKNEPDE